LQPVAENRTPRFGLQLFVVHPSIEPDAIGAELDLQARFSHGAGWPRHLPDGGRLLGSYPDTRWRYVEEHCSADGHFAESLMTFVERLEARKQAIQGLTSSGASLTLIIAFLGDGYYGDGLSTSLLRRISDLGVELGIEVYGEPQAR